MLEAIDKMLQFNQNRRIDMFKDGISVPGTRLEVHVPRPTRLLRRTG
jgi:hypothetical protein